MITPELKTNEHAGLTLTPVLGAGEGAVGLEHGLDTWVAPLKHRPEEVSFDYDEEPYFDAAMEPNITAYLGKTAVLKCIVHSVQNHKSVSILSKVG